MPTRPEPAPTGDRGGAPRYAAFLDLLLTVGHVDGMFHHHEQRFVRQYLDSVLLGIERSGTGSAEQQAQYLTAWRVHCDGLYAQLEAEVAALAAAGPPPGDGNRAPPQLRARALSIFRALAPTDQSAALELVQALIHADGMVTWPEQQLYDELVAAFAAAPTAPAPAAAPAGVSAASIAAAGEATVKATRPAPMLVNPARWLDLTALAHPLLDPLEQTYSPHPVERQSQIAWDYQLVQNAIAQWGRQRVAGAGLLTGLADVGEVPPGARVLDGYVHVMRPDHPVELIVLGDLHGCYSCLKAALLQSNFIQRVWAHQWDPARYPDVKLVFLGDYIDRGRFSFDGVLRAVLQLFISMPDHVVVLRGNHEYFVWLEHQIYSGVHPAEALASLTPYAPPEMLEAYRLLFEHMPTSLLFDRTLFVHGGIPRDDSFAERYRDLSSLNDPELRFQMLWSDPSPCDHVPVEQQRKNPRFSFGRQQFRAFMERTGCGTMIRGHEQIDRGFEVVFDLGDRLLLNLFSAGGADNADLPVGAPYRAVTPMALTIEYGHGQPRATPWPIYYQPFNYPPHNGLYRPQPLVEFRYT